MRRVYTVLIAHSIVINGRVNMSLMMTTYRCGATAAAKDDGEDGYSSGWGEFEEVAAGSVAPHRPESSRRRVTRRSQTLVTACYRNVITPRACYQPLIRNIFSWSTRNIRPGFNACAR